MSFHKFAQAVHKRFQEFQEAGELFEVGGPDLRKSYLEAFPEGTNPIYIKNSEHDCTCCKQFIQNLGSVVRINGMTVESIWDLQGLEYPYDVVAAKLNEIVLSNPIINVFRVPQAHYGAEHTFQELFSTDERARYSSVKKWHHFHGEVHRDFVDADSGQLLNESRVSVQLLAKGINEISSHAIKLVLDLIDDNNLYRGEEKREVIEDLVRMKEGYEKIDCPSNYNTYLWANYRTRCARLINSSMGTLLSSISEGKDLEEAVTLYEKMVGEGYKRSRSVITPQMVTNAMQTIQGLNLEPALARRHANKGDISVNNVLWVNGSAKEVMKSGVEALLMGQARTKPATKGATAGESIAFADFIRDVAPDAVGIEVEVENSHLGNLSAITAPVDTNVEQLFSWSNNFAWSYAGNVTDSIRERVKTAGGNVDSAVLRVSLAWNNHDDLDLHAFIMGNGGLGLQPRINFSNKQGVLDVDANSPMSKKTREPVENMSFRTLGYFTGTIQFAVHQFAKREQADMGFTVQVDTGSKVFEYTCEKNPDDHVHHGLVQVNVKSGQVTGVTFNSDHLTEKPRSKEKWGVKTGVFTPVETIITSPNHWEENGKGNKHWFFILKDCKCDEELRGIYNEFLRPELHQHRKVFEILGDKTKCPVVDEQLAGLGFSSTKPATMKARTTDKDGNKRLHTIIF